MEDTTFELWLEFEVWQPSPDGSPCAGEDPTDDFFNMTITLSTGERYALNVWTYKFMQRAYQADQKEGTNLHGKYLLPPDLLIEKLDRPLLEAVVADLITTNNLKDEWRVTDESLLGSEGATDDQGNDPIFAAFIEQARREGRLVSLDEHISKDEQ